MLIGQPDISVRPSGGPGIYQYPTVNPLTSEKKTFRRIILIHGFRNSEAEAMESYNLFKDYYSQYPGVSPAEVFSFIWPGDHLSANPLRYFYRNTKNSLEAGVVLGRYLVDVASKQRACKFIIVAHSLGCRLTAAMIREIHRIDRNLCKRFRIVLMAGAVPCDDVADPSLFRTSPEAVESTANLYSNNDNILRLLFPLGQLGGWRGASEAIGLRGGPKTFAWTKLQNMPGFGHSDYWRKPHAAEFVAGLVGANINRQIPVNQPTENSLIDHEFS